MTHKPKLQLLRYASVFDAARAVVEARTLIEALHWIEILEHRHRARPVYVPQVTGRWGCTGVNLQGVPKHSAAGRAIRGALSGPPGTVLVGADFSGFEVRLLADLSGDPILLRAASSQDAIEHFASEYFGLPVSRKDRELAKKCIHPFNYDQSREVFAAGLIDLDIPRARELYDLLHHDLAGVSALKRSVAQDLRANGYVATRGGWQRSPRARFGRTKASERKAFSTVVQGLGADILRHVLRELHAQLQPLGGRIVHQAHDEIFVAVEPQNAAVCANLMTQVMTAGVASNTQLVTPAIRLVVKKPKTGKTWADLV